MQSKQVGPGRFVVVLDRGEELIGTVTTFLAEQGIKGGFVRGLGALRNHTVGFYDLSAKEYLKRTFSENMELGNLTGSIGTVDGRPFLHAHVTVSGPELIAFTGHLVEGEVAVTAELLIEDFGVELPRETVEEVGLKLFAFAEKDDADDGGDEEEPVKDA